MRIRQVPCSNKTQLFCSPWMSARQRATRDSISWMLSSIVRPFFSSRGSADLRSRVSGLLGGAVSHSSAISSGVNLLAALLSGPATGGERAEAHSKSVVRKNLLVAMGSGRECELNRLLWPGRAPLFLLAESHSI